jgi:ribonuclease P protein component
LDSSGFTGAIYFCNIMSTTGKKFTLGRQERLKSRKLIERVFREGKSFALFPFRVFYLPVKSPLSAGQPSLQAGFGASARNFKKAVDRNRIKRLTREAYRLQKQDLQDRLKEKGQALAIFFVYTGKDLPGAAALTEKIGLALQRLVKETAS